MSYSVEWSRSAAREVRSLSTDMALRIAAAVGRLAQDPRPAGCKKLAGHADLWRIRVGQCRIIYAIGDTVRLVRVERVAHRKDAYR